MACSMLVSYFWSCLHPNSSSLSLLCSRFSSFSSKYWIVFWGKLQNRRASRVWVKWKEFLFIFLWSRIYSICIFSFNLMFWHEIAESVAKWKYGTSRVENFKNSHIFWALHYNKMTPTWERSEFRGSQMKKPDIMYAPEKNCTEPDTLLDHLLFSTPSLLSTLSARVSRWQGIEVWWLLCRWWKLSILHGCIHGEVASSFVITFFRCHVTIMAAEDV